MMHILFTFFILFTFDIQYTFYQVHICLQCEMFTACTHNTTMTAFRCSFFHNTELIAVLVETLGVLNVGNRDLLE